jgi:hypothetical protein
VTFAAYESIRIKRSFQALPGALTLLLVLVFLGHPVTALGMDLRCPNLIKVLPVFIVPKGEKPPTRDRLTRFMRHLELSRTRYYEMLSKRGTLAIAKTSPDIVQVKHPISYYHTEKGEAGSDLLKTGLTSELLEHFGFNRFNCPYLWSNGRVGNYLILHIIGFLIYR